MTTYIIERDLSGSNIVDHDGLRRLVEHSNKALARIAPNSRWIQSFFSKNKSFCLVSMSEAAIADFLRVSDLANVEVREITATIDETRTGGIRAVWTAMDSWSD